MKSEPKIQTMHPEAGKTNKAISLEKYVVMKEAMLKLLKETSPTHTEMMEALYQILKATFVGNVQWYAETVKLDLEARNLIKRTASKPARYSLF